MLLLLLASAYAGTPYDCSVKTPIGTCTADPKCWWDSAAASGAGACFNRDCTEFTGTCADNPLCDDTSGCANKACDALGTSALCDLVPTCSFPTNKTCIITSTLTSECLPKASDPLGCIALPNCIYKAGACVADPCMVHGVTETCTPVATCEWDASGFCKSKLKKTCADLNSGTLCDKDKTNCYYSGACYARDCTLSTGATKSACQNANPICDVDPTTQGGSEKCKAAACSVIVDTTACPVAPLCITSTADTPACVSVDCSTFAQTPCGENPLCEWATDKCVYKACTTHNGAQDTCVKAKVCKKGTGTTCVDKTCADVTTGKTDCKAFASTCYFTTGDACATDACTGKAVAACTAATCIGYMDGEAFKCESIDNVDIRAKCSMTDETACKAGVGCMWKDGACKDSDCLAHKSEAECKDGCAWTTGTLGGSATAKYCASVAAGFSAAPAVFVAVIAGLIALF